MLSLIKKKNEETKKSMKKTGERRRQATDFRKTVRCPSAVVQGAAWQKMVSGELLGPSGRPTVI